ncbi:centromere protein I isoform X2 [Megachile rotundata]|uniref:centromere protein I isoform X2 n=1 Tax=Megachile rotundata TaxID=143995 RepID=UPI0006149CBC|nr:PREDICTED: uncharacterized protein LOC100883839 isoform X1 [Megachile rotundata]XP_012136981.1 PREDICTED: uncharacterized protein LOC100883839 isoform X1 [Megachile rotundata]XP_012136982.1 PREDICTED: uncharacterized protein LOC100883839 isoform X1 [Megachile rotundata]XP_012136983.1 PREDICTED: uncharacterized protein LOC100883839 isoform X1 [Megachile rotundata]
MTNNEQRDTCLKLLHQLKAQNKAFSKFEELADTLQDYVSSKGLEDEDMDLLANIIINTDLSATKMITLIKCLIPKYKVPENTFKMITTWHLSSVNQLPITVSVLVIQWIIGLWDYHLIDKKIINIYYNVFFYVMLKKEKLEKQIARLIYVLTKPEDVTRRDVCRLLALNQKYSKPRTHISVLLSLFKSYKPELVPEKINSVNIESVWKPIPEVLRLMLQSVKIRLEVQETHDVNELNEKCFKWNTVEFKKGKKNVTPLMPSVGYFQIGSSIFKEKDSTSIFDISSTEELGKSHLSVELPCNAISLLTNTAGYHLLTFADFQYQSRFSYNLYNTLVRALMLENEKFSVEEINKLLDMTIEFSRYMQQGVLVVNRFLNEYLYFNTGEYQSKLLMLLQWMTPISSSDLHRKILVHIQEMFYESEIDKKCEIIKTLKMLITNLFVTQGFEECYHTAPAPFLGQTQVDSLEDIIPTLTKVSEDLIISGLNIHSYNTLLLAESLSFYEQVCSLEEWNNEVSVTLAPSAVIYGGFITQHCAILSRTCRLLLRYRNMIANLQNSKLRNIIRRKVYTIFVYAQEIVDVLWYDELAKKRNNGYLLYNVPDIVIKDLNSCDANSLLNVNNHYSFLPYKWILNKSGLNINTKMDAIRVALHYYPSVKEFISTFQT